MTRQRDKQIYPRGPSGPQAERVAPACSTGPTIAYDLDMMLSQMKRGSDTIWRAPTIG
jgi:hypothetical protein